MFSVVWYYICMTWIFKNVIVLIDIVYLTQNYGYVALVIIVLFLLKPRVPLGKFLDEKKWKISMILLAVYATMLLILTIIGGSLATGGVPAGVFAYMLDVMLIAAECGWFIVGCASMVSEDNPLHAQTGEDILQQTPAQN